MPRVQIWQITLGLAVSALLLWWVLRGTSLTEVAVELQRAAPGPILLGVVLGTACFGLRVFRWQVLLRAHNGAELPAGALWHATAIGFMANNVLPFRAGELVRVYAAHRLAGVGFTASLASVAAERLFDGFTVVALLAVGLFWAGLPQETQVAGITLGHATTLACLVVLALSVAAGCFVAWPARGEHVIRALLPAGRLADRLAGMLAGLHHGLSALRSPARILAAAIWSLLIWTLNALSFYAMYAAFAIDMSFAGTLLMQGLLMIGISVPSTPGYLGAFEAPIRLTLGFYDVPAAAAASYALTYHFSTFLPITLLGFWSLSRTGLGLGALRRGEP